MDHATVESFLAGIKLLATVYFLLVYGSWQQITSCWNTVPENGSFLDGIQFLRSLLLLLFVFCCCFIFLFFYWLACFCVCFVVLVFGLFAVAVVVWGVRGGDRGDIWFLKTVPFQLVYESWQQFLSCWVYGGSCGVCFLSVYGGSWHWTVPSLLACTWSSSSEKRKERQQSFDERRPPRSNLPQFSLPQRCLHVRNLLVDYCDALMGYFDALPPDSRRAMALLL